MTLRTWTLAALLLTTALAAGCTSTDDGAAPAPSPSNPGAGSAAPSPSNPGSGANTPPIAQPRPSPVPVTDSGDIQGAFDRAWEIRVPQVGARGMTIDFALAGIEAGAPPTARVELRLLDPNGAEVKRGVAGVGGDGDVVSWKLTGAEVATPGAYVLTAQASPEAGALPSAGLAKYQLYALAEY